MLMDDNGCSKKSKVFKNILRYYWRNGAENNQWDKITEEFV